MTKREFNILSITKAIIIAFLILGILDMPYGYYQIMRIAVTALFVFIGWYEWNENKYLISILTFVSAVTYQPFQKLAFNKQEWQEVDFIFIVLLILWILIDLIFTSKKHST